CSSDLKASLAGVTATAAGAGKARPDDFRVSITNAPGKEAYPISSFTWLLIPARISDAAKRDALKNFLTWMLADGQNYAEALSYARLPKEIGRASCRERVWRWAVAAGGRSKVEV